jgi:hypothetical protein
MYFRVTTCLSNKKIIKRSFSIHLFFFFSFGMGMGMTMANWYLQKLIHITVSE